MMQFMLLFSRQGKLRLQKWYVAHPDKLKKKITRELITTILARKPKMCSFLEWKDVKVVYKRYASLYFCCAMEQEDNELLTLELIHRYVELLDKYFGSVCELDIIFNFEKAYFILDELVLGGELQETSKKNVLKAIAAQDLLQEEEMPQGFFEDHGLGLGSIPLTDQVVANAEEFVVQLYKVSPEIKTGDAARSFLFGAVKNVENLPPTSGSLRLHIRRCHYQVCVWESAHIGKPSAPSPEDCGWRVNGTSIEPILMTLPPIPASCDALRSCGCKGLCQTNQCRCKKGADPCMKICNCRALCLNLLG